MTRRLTSAILLVAFALGVAAPAIAAHAAEAAKMSCCRRESGACCHSKRHSESGFEAAAECATECRLGSAVPQSGAAEAAAPARAAGGPDVVSLAIPAREQSRSRATAYLAFLYQIPPPDAA
jgi:hypothetical protein